MPQIHPSSIVDARAELADDVQIGPGCVIDGPVKIGAGTRLIGNVHLHGRVALGAGNLLYPSSASASSRSIATSVRITVAPAWRSATKTSCARA